MSDTTTDEFVRAIAGLVQMGTVPIAHPQGGLAVRKPNGDIQHLPPPDPVLTHVKQQVNAFDAASFIAYVNRFKTLGTADGDEKTTIFSDPNRFALCGVIDYHTGAVPDRLGHKITFEAPVSEQWARWRAIDGKPLSQMEFAEFVEENIEDIVEPEPARFLDLVTGLHAKKKVNFESGVRLQSGAHELTFAEEVEAKGRGQMVVPSEFAIGVPVFLGGAAYRVRVLLRYRIDEGRLIFIVKLHRRVFTEQTAFADIRTAVESGTGLKFLSAWT